MIRKMIEVVVLLMTITGELCAQQKQAHAWQPNFLKKGIEKSVVVDTAKVRIYYALNADTLGVPESYIDLGMLEMGSRVRKYHSFFVAQADTFMLKWVRDRPNSDVYPSSPVKHGKNAEYWMDYEYSQYFTQDSTLTEWAVVPKLNIGGNCRYSEPYPLMKWTLTEKHDSILGYNCQEATCSFRGRDFVAWFTPDIPLRYGPWKFGGLPGLILKVQDVDKLYTFQCVGIERGTFLITHYPKEEFPVRSRKSIYKLQVAYSTNYFKAIGLHSVKKDAQGRFVLDGHGALVSGDLMSRPVDYQPLEKE